ncbi:hypothetical protein GGE65_007271 [Skermanella aerolata]
MVPKLFIGREGAVLDGVHGSQLAMPNL